MADFLALLQEIFTSFFSLSQNSLSVSSLVIVCILSNLDLSRVTQKKKQWISLKNHQNLIMLGSWAFFCFFVKLQINLLDIANCLCKIALVRIPAVEGFLVWNFMWNSKMAFAWKFTILCNILAQRMACQATMSWSCFLWNRIKIISESNSIFDTNMQKEIFMIGNMIILVDFWKLFTLYSVTKYSFVFLS